MDPYSCGLSTGWMNMPIIYNVSPRKEETIKAKPKHKETQT